MTLALTMCIALVGCAYALSKVIHSEPSQGRDFRVIWVAGKTWNAGASPYADAYIDHYTRQFIEYHSVLAFAYPPNWALIALALSHLEFPTAEIVWRGINASGFFVILMLSNLWLTHTRCASLSMLRLGIVIFLACTMQPLAIGLILGQTTIIAVMGLALILFSIPRKWPVFGSIGIALLALKPQIGIFFIAFLIGAGAWRSVIGGAVLVVASMTLAFLKAGVAPSIFGFLSATQVYSTIGPNMPSELTGVVHLASLANLALSPRWVTLAGALFGSILGYWASRKRDAFGKPATTAPATIALCISSVLFIMPVHVYDFVLLSPLLLIAFSARAYFMAFAPGLLFSLRSGNLAHLTGLQHPGSQLFDGSLLASVAALMLVVGAFVLCARDIQRQTYRHTQCDPDAIQPASTAGAQLRSIRPL